MPRSRAPRLPDPASRYREVDTRRVPQVEFGAVLPSIVARQDAAFTTVSDAVDVVLLWDLWRNDDTRVFGESLTSGKLNTVILQLPGRYTLTCGVEWAGSWNADTRILVAGDYDENNEQSFPGRAGNYTGTVTATFSIIYPAPFEPATIGNAPGYAQWQVAQHSGAPQSTDFGTYMQITYDGPIAHMPEPAV